MENIIYKPYPSDEGAIQEAKQNPGGSVSEIDWPYPENQSIPPEAIRGMWKVDLNGNLTEEYVVNKNYRGIIKCERKLPSYMTEAAKHFRNIWVSEIAKEAEYLFPDIPDEKIVGWWYIDENGRITNLFRENSAYKK